MSFFKKLVVCLFALNVVYGKAVDYTNQSCSGYKSMSGFFGEVGISSLSCIGGKKSEVSVPGFPAQFVCEGALAGVTYQADSLSITMSKKSQNLTSVVGDFRLGYVHSFSNWVVSGILGYTAGGPQIKENGNVTLDWSAVGVAAPLVFNVNGSTSKQSIFSLSQKMDKAVSLLMQSGYWASEKWLPYIQLGCTWQRFVVSIKQSDDMISDVAAVLPPAINGVGDFHTLFDTANKQSYWVPALTVGLGLKYKVSPCALVGIEGQFLFGKGKKTSLTGQSVKLDVDGQNIPAYTPVDYLIKHRRMVCFKMGVNFQYVFPVASQH